MAKKHKRKEAQAQSPKTQDKVPIVFGTVYRALAKLPDNATRDRVVRAAAILLGEDG